MMNEDSRLKDLVAYDDGELHGEDAARMALALQHSPELAEELRQFQEADQALRVYLERVVPSCRQTSRAIPRRRHFWARGGWVTALASLFLLAVGLSLLPARTVSAERMMQSVKAALARGGTLQATFFKVFRYQAERPGGFDRVEVEGSFECDAAEMPVMSGLEAVRYFRAAEELKERRESWSWGQDAGHSWSASEAGGAFARTTTQPLSRSALLVAPLTPALAASPRQAAVELTRLLAGLGQESFLAWLGRKWEVRRREAQGGAWKLEFATVDAGDAWLLKIEAFDAGEVSGVELLQELIDSNGRRLGQAETRFELVQPGAEATSPRAKHSGAGEF